MALFEYPYTGLVERQVKVKEAEAQGQVMLHDNFDPAWKPGDEPFGTLIFTDEPPEPPPPPPPTPTYSSHLGKIVSITPGTAKPVKAIVHHGKENLDIEYDCFVTEAIKDQFEQGNLNPDDYVIVHFFENDVLKPVCTAKIYPSWE